MKGNMVKKMITIKEIGHLTEQDTGNAGRDLRWGLTLISICFFAMALFLLTWYLTGV